MAEWTIAAVLKAAIPPGIVGSNPTPSASGMAEKGAGLTTDPASVFGLVSVGTAPIPQIEYFYFRHIPTWSIRAINRASKALMRLIIRDSTASMCAITRDSKALMRSIIRASMASMR